MKQTFLLLVSTLTALALQAQFTVTGLVTGDDGVGEPFATVTIHNVNDTVNATVVDVTGDDGTFSLALPSAATYRLRVTAVGRQMQERQFTVSAAQPTAELGTIVLPVAPGMLAGIEVTAQRTLVKSEIDRLSYNVQSDVQSRTSTTLEMLRKVPLVSVDGEDNVRVKGNTNFVIYKNGHPDPILSGSNAKDVLKAIPASMIKRIEVITEPGAKYDAEGVSAILNIVMMDAQGMNGVTGTVNVRASDNGRFGSGAYITAQVGKLVTSFNYGNVIMPNHSQRSIRDSWTRYTATGDTLFTSGRTVADVNVHYGNLEASYEPDTLNLFSASIGGYYYDYDGGASIDNRMVAADGTPLYQYTCVDTTNTGRYYNLNGRADFQHRTHRPQETVTLSYMLSATFNKLNVCDVYDDVWNMPVAYDGTEQHGTERFWEHTWQLDWTRPFLAHNKVETGLKYIHRSNTSHTTMHFIDNTTASDDVDSRFNHLTQVGAAYASYTYMHNQLSARAGLRYEWSYLLARYPDGSSPSFHRTLHDWVPSASINYQMGLANSLKLAFATRINRPGISYLNPAVIDSPTSTYYGNAHLSSARNYSLSLTFMHIGPKFTFNVVPSYGWSNNEITEVETVSDGKTISTYDNTLASRRTGLSGFMQWQITGTTSLMFNGDLEYNDLRSDELGLKNSGWGSFFFSQLTQQLPWDMTATAMCGKWGGGTNGLYGHNGHNWFYGFSLQRSFLADKQLTVSINAHKPFSPRYGGATNYVTQGDYTAHYNNKWIDRGFSIQVSYRFGSLRARVKKTDTTIENNDVVGGSSAAGGGAQQQQGGQGM